MQTIYLDISNKGVVPVIYAKQGDVGRKFEVVLTDSGLPYIPVGGSAFSVWYSGASGEGNYTDIGGQSAFSLTGNKVIVEMISQMLLNDGDGFLSLVLNDPDGDQISTWNIPYICEFVPGFESEEATSYYTAFSETVENLQKLVETDPTVPSWAKEPQKPTYTATEVGARPDTWMPTAADVGAAPAGYGLGKQNEVTITSLSELDTTYFNGWYKFQTFNGENIEGHSLGLLYVNSSTSSVEQIFVPYRNPYRLIRVNHAEDGWGVWEYENPPMVLGVEYRTTEKWQNKPVYTMLQNVGSFPSAGAVSYYTIRAGITKMLRVKGTAANAGFAVPYTSTDAYLTISGTVYGGVATILVYVEKGDLAADECIAQLWYIKD